MVNGSLAYASQQKHKIHEYSTKRTIILEHIANTTFLFNTRKTSNISACFIATNYSRFKNDFINHSYHTLKSVLLTRTCSLIGITIGTNIHIIMQFSPNGLKKKYMYF